MTSKIILITGGNRDIGFGIVQALCQKSSKNIIVIASRKHDDTEEAIREAQKLGYTNQFHSMTLDVTNDESIDAAVKKIQKTFGKLDVLVNNAGLGLLEDQSSTTSWRSTWNRVYDTNVTSVRIVTHAFLPLLRKGCNGAAPPMVVNISSARGSFARADGNPPTASIPYSVSKAALNLLTLEMAKVEPELRFYAVSPGNCNTAFNGYRGLKDPVDGGRCAAELAVAEGDKVLASGFWEHEDGEMREVGW